MGISSFSTQYLPRNLRVLGIGALFLGMLYAWGGISDSSIPLLISGVILCFMGIMFFSVASGVSKKEKWASVCGILWMGLGIINCFIQFFLAPTELIACLVGIVIAVLLLISFIRSLKEGVVSSISIFPFLVTIIGFCLIIAGWVFTVVLVVRH